MSNIKIQDIYQRIQYVATSNQTLFAIPFPFFEDTDVFVYQDDVLLDMGSSPGEYSIAGAGSPSGGSITLVTPVNAGVIITVMGKMPIDRTSIYSPTISNLTGTDLNTDFNREVVMVKQLETVQDLLQLRYAPWAEVSQDVDDTTDRYLPILGPQQVWMKAKDGSRIEPVTLDFDDVPAPSDAMYWVSASASSLENEVNMALLGSGILKQNVVAGMSTPSIAQNGVDYWAPGDDLYSPAVPFNPTDVANKAYVDSIVSGFNFVVPCDVATIGNISATYDNGTSGVGATLTANSNGVAVIDGINLSLGDRVLFHNQNNAEENGVYVVTQVGDVSNPAIYERSTDYDTIAEIKPGNLVPVFYGNSNAGTLWLQTADVVNIGIDSIVFVQFAAAFNNIVTIQGTQTITGQKTFSNDVIIDNSSTLQLNSTVAIDEILDEDNMASDSNTAVPTQQSVKAYIDSLVAQASPVGTIIDFAGISAPTGYLVCDGSLVSRATYAALFAAIGTIWGAGDGVTTFALPDFRRRVSVGAGGSGTGILANTPGSTGGAETVALTATENGPHRHVPLAGNGFVVTMTPGSFAFATGNTGHAYTETATSGAGGAHNNIQPSAVVLKCIKYQ